MCKKCIIIFIAFLLIVIVGLFFILKDARAENPSVVINEIAWMGTSAEGGRYCEWIELYNNNNNEINLDGWILYEQGGDVLVMGLSQNILPYGYYLIERVTNSCPDAVPGINADDEGTFGGSGLKNLPDGEHLVLKDANGNIIDEVSATSGWFAGDNSSKQTMERIDPLISGNNSSNWTNGPEGGTPKAQNYSATTEPIEPEPQPQPEPEPESEPEPTTPPPAPEPEPEPEPETNEEMDQAQQKEENNDPQFVKTNDIIISEFMPNPEGNDSENEWIEIYNLGNETINISGWFLDNREEGKTKPFQLPENTTIMSGEYRVFYSKITRLRLTNTQDTARLLYPDNTVAYETEYTEKAKDNYSFALIGKNWEWTDNFTPGAKNVPATKTENKNETGTTTKSAISGSKTSSGNNSETNNKDGEIKTISANELSANLNQDNNNMGAILPLLVGILISIAGGAGFWILKKKYINF